MRLEELQRKFSECVRGDGAGHVLPIVRDGLRVYRNNYREQLRAALRSSFPVLALWLGEAEFDRAAEMHILTAVPQSWTLDHYGHDFPATLGGVFPDDPEVAELAWLDWAMTEALVAEDQPPLGRADLVARDWDVAKIAFMASLKISEARSNAAAIWSAIEEQKAPPPAGLTEPHAILVWRRGLLPCFRTVPTFEYQAIFALIEGFSFADACEILRLRLGPDRAIRAASAMLARWVDDEIIAGVEDSSLAGSVTIARPLAN